MEFSKIIKVSVKNNQTKCSFTNAQNEGNV